MELKLGFGEQLSRWHILLIVPYGIETKHCYRAYPGNRLLIVPYGIETSAADAVADAPALF